MGVVGEINRLAITSWAPAGIGGGYIAAGTFAGAIDPSFKSGASLELLAVDIQNSRLTVATDCRTSEKFCSVTWGTPSRAHPAGLIAGGLDDGTVRVWDAAALLRSPASTDDEEKGVVFGGSSFQKKHSGSVRALSFNPFVPTLLASGGADTKLFIWDLSNPGEGPSIRPPGSQQMSANPMPSDEVTAVAWNRRVQHILGSGTVAGVLHIWDLKQRRQVISIRNPNNRMRCSAIHWHPDIATQVLTTCDQDNGSGAILWDLRNATAPVMTFDQFASRGIASASWCPHDSEMIMLATREPRNVIVSPATGETLCDLQASPAPSFDVQWSPRIPGMYLTSSIDALVTVKSLLSADASSSVSVDTANALAASFGEMATDFRSGLSVQSPRTQREERRAVSISRPPKWLRRPVSVSFGPTGTFATALAKEGARTTIAPVPKSQENVRESVSGLDAILIDVSASDPSQAERLCRDEIAVAENADAAMGFEVLSVLMQKDSRRKMLSFLGYDVSNSSASGDVYGILRSDPLASPVRTLQVMEQEPNIVEESNTHKNPDPVSSAVLTDKVALSGPAPWDAPNDIPDMLMSESILDGDDSKLPPANGHALEDAAPAMNGHTDFKDLSDSEVNDVVRKALVVGDLEKAVRACLFVGRTSDALVIAHTGGPKLWLMAQSQYLSSISTQDGGNLLGAIAGPLSKMDDLLRGTDNASKGSWKEALAVVLTYIPGKDIAESCSALGQRLLLAGLSGPALVCFLCAGNTKMATSTWMQNRPATGNRAAASASRIELLISLVRKVRLVTAATLLGMGDQNIGTVRALDDVSGKVLCEFGGLLAVEGELDLAVTYLCNLDPDVTGIYGSAGDIHAQASGALSAAQPLVQESSGMHEFPGTGYAAANYGYSQPGVVDYNQQAFAPPVQSWNQTPDPVSNTGPYVQPPAPPAIPSPQPIQNMYSASVSKTDRRIYDPSSAYAGAPSYDNYAMPSPADMLPPVPGQGPPPSVSAPPVPMAPPAPMVVPPPASSAPVQVPQPMIPSMMSSNFHSAGTQSFQPPPPPPPPTDESMPTSYHAKAKPGSGRALPPSAEIAVAATRNQVPGGPPKRSHSSSSSLSSMAGNDPSAYLDKADVGSIPPNQQVIVKSLRGAYAYALKRSTAMMYRKKMEDINKKLGRLVSALNKGTVDPEVVPHLIEIGKFIEKGNYDSASGVVSTLTMQHWDNNVKWIQGLKRLIDCVLTGR